MPPQKREWSQVSAEQMSAYADEATRLIVLAKEHKISAFGAALAGVAMIRNALALMGGKPEWWFRLITSSNPLDEIVKLSNEQGSS